MKIEYDTLNLNDVALKEIKRLLLLPQENRSDLEQMWFLMDKVWDEYGCDSRHPDQITLGRFYAHPVWLLNGLFIEQHGLSRQHREAISDWVARANFESVIDYGGGSGALAKLIVKKNARCHVAVYEPHLIDLISQKLNDYDRIGIVTTLGLYECLVSTDVLEHVTDPLKTLSDMINAVRYNGFLIIANNFRPVIKCHLPQTFHLKFSFNFFAWRMGLKKIGQLEGSHATIYKKDKQADIDLRAIRRYERVSKACYPVLESVRLMKNAAGRFF
jgi:SAM-dependent methyltransferase